jgi:hypothetical protein
LCGRDGIRAFSATEIEDAFAAQIAGKLKNGR